jgi:hypothetical protein
MNEEKITEDLLIEFGSEINKIPWDLFDGEIKTNKIKELIAKIFGFPFESKENDFITDKVKENFFNVLYPKEFEERLIKREDYQTLSRIKKEKEFYKKAKTLRGSKVLETQLPPIIKKIWDKYTKIDAETNPSLLVKTEIVNSRLSTDALIVDDGGNPICEIPLFQFITTSLRYKKDYLEKHSTPDPKNVTSFILTNQGFLKDLLKDFDEYKDFERIIATVKLISFLWAVTFYFDVQNPYEFDSELTDILCKKVVKLIEKHNNNRQQKIQDIVNSL